MKKLILIAIGLLPILVLARGEATNHEVELVRVDKSGTGYVQFTTNLVAQNGALPACGTSYPRALAFDTNTAGGKSILSLVLAAKMSKTKIFARGTNACAAYGVIEDWDYGYVK
jgi:hypothetical protein